MLKDLIQKNRSYRRFHQDVEVNEKTLNELIELARLSPSGMNKQPLRFILSFEAEKNAAIFENTRWARNLPDWPGPEEGERPSAYIVILGDTTIRKPFGQDPGIAAHSILLGATERGLGGCMIGNLNREGLRTALDIDEKYEIPLVLAIGKPKETVVIEELEPDGDYRYYRDGEGVHYVPKRGLNELIIG
ncbi:MAG: nitroreductase family protein [bacterium]|nr:nitroreductase family protein [bacterium]